MSTLLRFSWSTSEQEKILQFFADTAYALTKKYRGEQNPYMCLMMDTPAYLDGRFARSGTHRSNVSTQAVQACLELARVNASVVSSFNLHRANGSGCVKSGAIRLPDHHLISIAGFAPEINEAYAVGIATAFGLIDDTTKSKIEAISGNTLCVEVKNILAKTGVVT